MVKFLLVLAGKIPISGERLGEYRDEWGRSEMIGKFLKQE